MGNKVLRFFKRLLFGVIIKFECGSYGKKMKVNHYSKVTKSTVLGENVSFNGMIINAKSSVYIGDNFHSGRECLIIGQNHNYDNGNSIPYDKTYIYKDIYIEENVWIGDRVIILPGVHIGEGAIIQAGSVISSHIPAYSIAGGNPARVFKMRDIEHYKKLKREEKFY